MLGLWLHVQGFCKPFCSSFLLYTTRAVLQLAVDDDDAAVGNAVALAFHQSKLRASCAGLEGSSFHYDAL